MIVSALADRAHRALGCENPVYISPSSSDYKNIVLEEFGIYGVNEYTTSPFSMRFYSPALYLFSRDLIPSDHPFCRYMLAYIVSSIIGDKAWRHVAPNSPLKPSSFCTALALLTVCVGVKDLSRNKVDPVLLLKGVKEIELELLNLDGPIKIFISYSSTDQIVAAKVAEKLRSMGFGVTYAETDLLVGDSIPEYINDGLTDMDYFIIFMSMASTSSRFVKDEFDGAKALEWSRRRAIILPALLENCPIPPLLAAKKYANFSNSFERGMQELTRSIENRHDKRKKSIKN